MKIACEIDISLQARLKAGSLTSQVKDAKKDEKVFKLSLKGEMPKLAEVKDDPSMLITNEDGETVSPARKSVKMKPCEIDVSLA